MMEFPLDDDFELPDTITIPASSSSQTVMFVAKTDNLLEDEEMVNISLSSSDGAVMTGAISQTRVTISDTTSKLCQPLTADVVTHSFLPPSPIPSFQWP